MKYLTVVGGIEEILELCTRKLVGYCKQNVMGYGNRTLEDNSSLNEMIMKVCLKGLNRK